MDDEEFKRVLTAVLLDTDVRRISLDAISREHETVFTARLEDGKVTCQGLTEVIGGYFAKPTEPLSMSMEQLLQLPDQVDDIIQKHTLGFMRTYTPEVYEVPGYLVVVQLQPKGWQGPLDMVVSDDVSNLVSMYDYILLNELTKLNPQVVLVNGIPKHDRSDEIGVVAIHQPKYLKPAEAALYGREHDMAIICGTRVANKVHIRYSGTYHPREG